MQVKLTHMILISVIAIVVTMGAALSVTGWNSLKNLALESAKSVTEKGLHHAWCIMTSTFDTGRETSLTIMVQHSVMSMMKYGTVWFGERDDYTDFTITLFSHNLYEPAVYYLGVFGRYGDTMTSVKGLDSASRDHTDFECRLSKNYRGDNQSLEIRLADQTTTYRTLVTSNYTPMFYLKRPPSTRLRPPEWPTSPAVATGGSYGYDSRLRSWWHYLMEPNISASWRPVYPVGSLFLITYHRILYNSEYVPEASIQVDYSLALMSNVLREFRQAETGKVYVVEYHAEVPIGKGRFAIVVHPNATVVTTKPVNDTIHEGTMVDRTLGELLMTLTTVDETPAGIVQYKRWTHGTEYAVGWLKVGTAFEEKYPPLVAVSITPLSEYMETASSSAKKFIIIAVCTSVVGVCFACAICVAISASFSPLMSAMEHANTLKLDEIPDTLGNSRIKEFHVIGNSFTFLTATLMEYIKYLPQDITDPVEEDAEDTEMQLLSKTSPPSNLSKITVVFTDIQGNSNLWNECPEGMVESLSLHHSCIRTQLVKHEGYEVKIIGDAFMIAFQDVGEALAFCVDTQKELLNINYPDSLLQSLYCRKILDSRGSLMWNGFRVRMGMMSGPVEAEPNPLTGRIDFFGATVNKAARVQATGYGGLIITSSECFPENTNLNIKTITFDDKLVKDFGAGNLIGVVPAELEERLVSIKVQEGSDKRRASKSSVSTLAGGGEKKVIAKLDTRLGKSCATVSRSTLTPPASCDMVGEVNVFISHIDEACERCGGTVMQMQGTNVMCIWNGEKKCITHAAQAARFAVRFAIDFAESSKVVQSTSLVTGHMWHGNIGTEARRYHMAVGGAYLLAVKINTIAVRIGAPLLMAESANIPGSPSDRTFAPVLSLLFTMSSDQLPNYISVYRADLAQCEQSHTWGVCGSSLEIEEKPMQVVNAVEAAMEGTKEPLLALAAEHNDPVLKKLAHEVKPCVHPSEDPELVWGEVSIDNCECRGSCNGRYKRTAPRACC
eukprot:TRINITY_DN5310_c4_g1_i1.p1 TRINITY_DN5310_c4_g1~~TRINITY_DN5310_c4_g1_i1.p1  ORF type:complete len:1025 (+),score=187.32 TRINITY_DN5310_c4_g1_i1:55-3075(+)